MNACVGIDTRIKLVPHVCTTRWIRQFTLFVWISQNLLQSHSPHIYPSYLSLLPSFNPIFFCLRLSVSILYFFNLFLITIALFLFVRISYTLISIYLYILFVRHQYFLPLLWIPVLLSAFLASSLLISSDFVINSVCPSTFRNFLLFLPFHFLFPSPSFPSVFSFSALVFSVLP